MRSNTVIEEADVKVLEKIVCKMYHPNKPEYDNINKLRVDCFLIPHSFIGSFSLFFRQKFQSRSSEVLTSTDGIDLSLLPPCRSSLKMHIVHSNYQSLIWKSALVPYAATPSPIGNGWTKDEAGNLEYEWTDDFILPPELLNILAATPDIQGEDSDLESDVDGDVKFDNHIDTQFGDDTD